MARITLRQLLDHAAEHDYGVPAFNINNMEQALAIMEAANAADAPVIIQASRGARAYANDVMLKHMMDALTEIYPQIPICVHLDHGNEPATCMTAIQSGFTSVMIDGSLLPYEENVALTREVVQLAHAVGVSVEGELGTIGQTGTSVEGGVSEVTYTDPAQAEDFVARTGVDTLAVAIGTAHGIYPKGMQPELQMHILRDIAGRLSIPLVLHGGSANPDAEIAESVTLGVGKINIS
ncbi:MAG: ketose-bisphosphate aldolase, partial [Pseudomonas aeruginosa]|nr:ketose-bisphosphate aldolase [Pseudomonas aeruginosa]